MAKGSMGIAIGESGIGSVLNRYSLKVPLNQRSYAWRAHHVKTLLQDFSNAIANENKTYFLGTIVLTQSGDNTWEVADGQQRLATTALLISAIRDFLAKGSSNEQEAARKYTQNFLLEFDEMSGEHLPKMRLNVEDNDFFVKSALIPPDSEDRVSLATKHIESHARLNEASAICHQHVKTIIAQYARPDQAKRLYDWISFIRDYAIIIEIRVPDSFNAYTLFETLNDRGLRASQADILKNYLFGRAQDRLSEVAPKWTAMSTILESVDADDLTLTFLRHYWISYNGPTVAKELAEKIREKVVGRQQAVDMANALAVNAADYAALFSPIEHTGWAPFDKQTRGYVYIMTRILQIEQIRPLLLSIIRHFEPAEVLKAFRLCLSWSVRFLIAGGGGGGVLDHHYGLRAREITAGEFNTATALSERMKGVVRSDPDFRDGMKQARVSKKHLARYYLRAIELFREGDQRPELGGILEDTAIYNLEHVMPQNPSSGWPLSDETLQHYTKRLGNMTLLDPTENVDMGNKGFDEKRAVFAASPLLITQEIGGLTSWNADEVEKRQALFAEDALKIWTS